MRFRVMWSCLSCLMTSTVWSFQMIVSPAAHSAARALRPQAETTSIRHAFANGSVPRSSAGGTTRPRMTAGSESERRPTTLKAVVVSFFAAALTLAGQAGPALSSETAAWPSAVLAASTANADSALSGGTLITEPTAKLEGELASVFRKAQDAGSVQQFDKALKLYNQVVKYAPGYVYGWSNRANVFIAEGDLKGAIADYDKALELSEGLSMPDKWVIYLNRGTTLLAIGEDDLALADLNQAAFLNKQKDLYTLANRAQALERKGEWAKALVDYEGAVNVQPGNVQPWWIRYGLVLFQEGKDFDSVACLRRIQVKFEGVGEVQAALTAVQFGRGETREAEKEWRAINKVDQEVFLRESYTKDKLKWPPRVTESLQNFDRLVVRGEL